MSWLRELLDSDCCCANKLPIAIVVMANTRVRAVQLWCVRYAALLIALLTSLSDSLTLVVQLA